MSAAYAFTAEAATRRIAIVATSGAGKSNAAVTMAEDFHRLGVPWVAIDPKGDWWGIRVAGTGRGGDAGLQVPVLGGLHGDVPLDPAAGKQIGRMIAERRMTCVLDVSEFDTRQDGFRFLADLAEALLRWNTEPLHLFLEEADEYLPQSTREKGNLPRCLGAWQRLVRRGRQRGIGSTLISQRSAVVNKDVLYMAEALVAMRIASAPDRRTIQGWVVDHDVAPEILDTLPTLADGEAWLISPGWLKTTERIRFRRRSTFDSGSTPTLSAGAKPAALAPVDLDALKSELSATIERAQADDPVRLRAEIAELRREIRGLKLLTDHPVIERVEVEVEVPVEVRPDLESLEFVRRILQDQVATVDGALDRMQGQRRELIEALRAVEVMAADRPTDRARESAVGVRESRPATRTRRNGVPDSPAPAPPRSEPRPPVEDDGGRLGGAAAKIVAVLAQHPEGLRKRQLPQFAGIKARTSTVRNALSTLRQRGYLDESGDVVRLSPAGFAAAGDVEGPPTGEALLDYWRERLGDGASRRLFDVLVAAYPGALDRETLAERAEIDTRTSTLRNALSVLRGYGLIVTSGDHAHADAALMVAAGREF